MVREGYKETEIGIIPQDWDVKTLNDCVSFLDHKRVPIKDSERQKMRGRYPYYGASGIIDYVNKYIFDGTYILLGEDGANIVDRSSRLAFVISGKCWINNHAHVLSPHTDFNIYFLAEYLESIRYDEYNTGTAQPKLNREKCCSIPIPVPALIEQQKIAEALSNMDNLISSLEKLIEKKKAIKQGAMQELLSGKKRLTGFSGEWNTKTLKEISCEIVDGPFGSDLKKEHYTTERQVRIIQLSNIGESGWNDENTKYTTFVHATELSRCIVQPGAILIAKMMPAGRAIVCPNIEKGYILGSDVVKLVPDDCIDGKYLIYATKSQFYLDQIAEDTQGSTRSRTSVSKLRKTSILFPPKSEQIAIASILSDMDNEIESLEQKLAKCQKLKQGMMQQLLTGKIRLVSNDDVVKDKPEVDTLKISPKGHNHQFDDAVVIAGIVDKFYSDKYPLGRKKVQKLLYLFRRHQEADTSAFKKKAAGPYADEVRYKGGEPIAISSKYISVKRATKGSSFSKGEKISDALEYLENWNLNADLKWLCEQFKYIKTDRLELLATIDMAMCDLDDAGITVTVDSIKELIKLHSEWKEKLSKSYFKDNDIAWAIKECKRLFN